MLHKQLRKIDLYSGIGTIILELDTRKFCIVQGSSAPKFFAALNTSGGAFLQLQFLAIPEI